MTPPAKTAAKYVCARAFTFDPTNGKSKRFEVGDPVEGTAKQIRIWLNRELVIEVGA